MSFINSLFVFIDKGDHFLVRVLFENRSDIFAKVFLTITDLGSAYSIVFISIVMLFAMMYWKKRRDLVIPFIVTMAGAIGTSEVLKYLIHRVRPDEMYRLVAEIGFSMPSIHATAVMALYGFFAYIGFKESQNIWYRIYTLLFGILVILLVGFSRIYIGVHYPSDVLAGYIVGFLWLFVGIHIKHLRAR